MKRSIVCFKGITAAVPTQSFHKRVLPKSLIALSSPEGKTLFKEALNAGGMESFFPLAEQFITQSEPAYCSLSSLAMVMNALNFDPKKVWKGPWRWVSEEMLQCEAPLVCGHSLERVKKAGMNFKEFTTLAKCHGVDMKPFRAHADHEKEGLSKFRSYIYSTSTSVTAASFVVVNFSRSFIGQTGNGHFSPVGGIHVEKDLLLVMDTARFKYPPFWVPVRDMWHAMGELDDEKSGNGTPRGYFVISSPQGQIDRVDKHAHAHDHTHDHSHSHCHGQGHQHTHQLDDQSHSHGPSVYTVLPATDTASQTRLDRSDHIQGLCNKQ